MNTALDRYTDSMPTVRLKAEEAGAAGKALVVEMTKTVITTPQQYEVCAGILKEVKAQIKFIDQERKVSTAPLNEEVDRVNDWYRPALASRREVVEHLEKLMSAFVMQQRCEAARLLAEAEEAARASLAAAKAVTPTIAVEMPATVVATAVTAAAAAAVPKVKGISTPDTFAFTVVDPSKVPREFLMVDMKALAAHVKANGMKNVPAGVEVQANVRIATRS